MKSCRDCKLEKPKEDFIKNKEFKDGIDTLCKVCNRTRVKLWRQKNPDKRKIQAKRESVGSKIYNQRKHLKHVYGITIEYYNNLFDTQKGCCAICGIHQNSLKRKLCVDHCHTSGRVRQLLCNNCNTLLGNAKENIDILLNAIDYIKKHTGY